MEVGNKLNIRMSTPDALNINLGNKNADTLKVNLGNGSGGTRDYNKLYNKPSINGIELVGNISLTDLGVRNTLTGNTEHWNNQRDFIPECGQIVVYIDKEVVVDQDGNETTVPGIKIGDGNAYLADLPWVGGGSTDAIMESLENHIHNTDVHVTAAERLAWNQKVDVRVNEHNQEMIEFFR